MVHTETPVRVLMITGSARSGSTVLDIVLGNHPDIESVGEVANIFVNGWISHESLRGIDPKKRRVPICTCGKRLDVLYVDNPEEACPFWSRVREEWVERTDPDSIESYPKIQNEFEPQGRWPRLLYEERRPSASFRFYAGMTRAFFESIRAVSGKPLIVDCSKISVRAFALGMVPGIDVYVLHLVRDGRGVTASKVGSFRAGHWADPGGEHEDRPTWKTGVRRGVVHLVSLLRWMIGNLLSEWVCARLGPDRTMRLRYEDFVADPKGALERIGSLLGLDLGDLAEAASSGEPMQAGHNVGGNKTKKSGVVTLRPDAQEWRTALSPMGQRFSWALVGWLMRRYGYKQ
jgi:hypothetical protein